MKGHGKMEDNKFIINDKMGLTDQVGNNSHHLKGVINISRINTDNGEKEHLFTGTNIIPVSGMQWVLMKMFGLHLDSVHDPSSSYEQDGMDTSTVIPDLNNDDQLSLGIAPAEYSKMVGDISADHFIQGFMVGNGGSGEDSISTKNTDYCFIKLRNPIPFQETSGTLENNLAGKYLGRDRSAPDKKYFIKKFDERAHIYHNWWKDGQQWDYIDPVTQNDLGPAPKSVAKTNRIETYAEVTMSIDTKNGDCIGFFNANSNQSAVINELGLVSYDAAPGTRSTVEALYNNQIKKFLNVLFNATESSETVDQELKDLATEIDIVLTEITDPVGDTHIDAFHSVIDGIKSSEVGSIDYQEARDELCSATNIEVTAMYNQTHQFVYETDKFLYYLSGDAFADMTTDEAQRIKLVTYYTFKSIPLQSNWKILISYRIYAN